ncbi:MAG: hypothetical protein A2583_11540 [Bdellovibrionales bacterium RIFOXYD1_FULL_53_11]|nr:MAG: hypothetical protein A2583_11540 [Bdellovibrionales bacterium RIFOXYD1_FULL_53_11]
MLPRILRFAEYFVLIGAFIIASDAIAKNMKKHQKKNLPAVAARQISSKLAAPQLAGALKDKPVIYSKPSAFSDGSKSRFDTVPEGAAQSPVRSKAFPVSD